MAGSEDGSKGVGGTGGCRATSIIGGSKAMVGRRKQGERQHTTSRAAVPR